MPKHTISMFRLCHLAEEQCLSTGVRLRWGLPGCCGQYRFGNLEVVNGSSVQEPDNHTPSKMEAKLKSSLEEMFWKYDPPFWKSTPYDKQVGVES